MKKKILHYTVVFEPAEEGGYIASVPSLPGCMTQGATFEEAVVMVKDAIQGYIQVLEDEKKTIPKESESAIITKISVDPYAFVS